MTRQLSAAILIAMTCLPTGDSQVQEVEVLRDPWGVPHIFAESEEAGFFGLGYATAEDRRLQMELVRRKGAGRLAEVFGPEWVQSDRESRIAGFPAWSREALTRLPAEMQSWLGFVCRRCQCLDLGSTVKLSHAVSSRWASQPNRGRPPTACSRPAPSYRSGHHSVINLCHSTTASRNWSPKAARPPRRTNSTWRSKMRRPSFRKPKWPRTRRPIDG